MKVIYSARGTGKTTELINLASQDGGSLICHSYNEAVRIAKVAKEMGKSIPFPLTYEEYLKKNFYAIGIRAFYIDNVELLLAEISRGVPVKAITISTDNL